ncbi:MAG: ATPase, T2SS/T4P/T4SS family [Endomicrobia bacterium]|nr:ATPase, T2SS/T4P/T4SS family [Endomicrobiia bacterium]
MEINKEYMLNSQQNQNDYIDFILKNPSKLKAEYEKYKHYNDILFNNSAFIFEYKNSICCIVSSNIDINRLNKIKKIIGNINKTHFFVNVSEETINLLNRNIERIMYESSSVYINRKEIIDNIFYNEIQSKIQQDGYDSVSVLDFSKYILYDFLHIGGSDLHLHSSKTKGMIKYRINGILELKHDNIPLDYMQKLIHSFCLLGNKDHVEMYHEDISTTIKMNFGLAGNIKQVEFRFQSSPAIPLPVVVIRSQQSPIRDITKIGFLPEQLDVIYSIIKKDSGIFIVAGPTGSGKTNTLESIMAIIEQEEEKHIIEVGDPIEVESEYRTQINITRKQNDLETKEKLYEKAFLSCLRLDPDVIYFTELRSKNVVSIAINASLSGHKVYTTIHSANIKEIITRLYRFGIEVDLIARSIVGLSAQRLVRVLCDNCKIQRKEGYIQNSNGCNMCIKGIIGRTAIAEVIEINERNRQALQNRDIDKIKYKTMKEVLLEKIKKGQVSYTELLVFEEKDEYINLF